MDFKTSVKTVYSKYVTFSGRAQRSEFWWFALFYFVAYLVLGMIDSVLFGTVTTSPGSFSSSTDTPILSGIFALGSLLPNLAVAVRRLHDIGKSGWWLLISFIPLVGAIILIVWFATGTTRGANKYGSDPMGGDSDGGSDADLTGAPGEGFSPSSVPDVPRD